MRRGRKENLYRRGVESPGTAGKGRSARKAARRGRAGATPPKRTSPPWKTIHAASFTALIGSLATQAMFALGLVAEPGTGSHGQPDAARHARPDDHAAGENRLSTSPRSRGLAQALGELEQAFAVRVQQFEQQAMRQSGIDPANLKGAPEA